MSCTISHFEQAQTWWYQWWYRFLQKIKFLPNVILMLETFRYVFSDVKYKISSKISLGRSPFLRYRVFWCILLVTGLVTDLKHRVMVMLWKIFVDLAYHIVIFNADIMNFMADALFPVVFRELLMFLSKFLPFWAKLILQNTYLATYTLPDNKSS